MVALSPKEITLLRRVRKDPVLFASSFLKIVDKHERLIKFRYNQFQRHLAKHMTARTIILKARQMGCSTMVQGEFFRKALTRHNFRGLTISIDGESAEKLLDKIKLFYKHLPQVAQIETRYNKRGELCFDEMNSTLYVGKEGSKGAGRSDTLSGVHLSEFAFYMNPNAVLAGVMKAAEYGEIIIESTPNGKMGRGKPFYEEVQKAIVGDSTFKVLFCPWWMDPTNGISLNTSEIHPNKIDKVMGLVEVVNGKAVVRPDEEENFLVTEHGLSLEQVLWRRWAQIEHGMFFQQECAENIDDCFLRVEGLVFDEFNKAVHGCSKATIPDDFDMIVASVDWGYTHPFVISIYGVKCKFNSFGYWPIWKLDEVYEYGYTPGEMVAAAKRVAAHWNPLYFICDSEDPAMIAEFNVNGLISYPVKKVVIPGTTGKAFVQQAVMFAKQRLRVDKNGTPGYHVNLSKCPNTVSEFQNWVNVKGAPAIVGEDAMKTFLYISHSLRAMELQAQEKEREAERDGQRELKRRLATKHGREYNGNQITVL